MAGKRVSETAGSRLYRHRRETGAPWLEVAEAVGWRPELPAEKRGRQAMTLARRHARTNRLPWPLSDRDAAERETLRVARARWVARAKRRIEKILDGLPADRPIAEDEAERVIVALYRTGMTSTDVAICMGCSSAHVLNVMRRRAPKSIRRGRGRAKSELAVGPVYNLGKAREYWRAEGYRARRAEQDARMAEARRSGQSFREIGRREGLSVDAVSRRIAAAKLS